MQRNVRSLAFGRYVPIGDIAAAAHSKRKRPATEATSFDAVRSDRLTQVGLEKELFLDLHNVPAYRLLRFVTLGCQVCPGLRLIKCNRIVHAVPLDDGHILGSCRSFYVLNPSVQGAQCVTVGLLDRLADGWEVAGLGCSIDHFDLADTVGFQLSLRVQPLYGRCTKCGSGNGGEHDLGLCIHERFPLCGLNQAVRPPKPTPASSVNAIPNCVFMGVSSLRLGSSGAFEVERRGRCLTLESLSRSHVRVCIKLLTAPDFYRTPEKACLFPRRAERQTSTARTLSAGRCAGLQPPIGGLALR